MRSKFLGCFFIAFLAIGAFGQAPDQDMERVLRATHSETPQDLQDVALMVRTMAAIRDVSVDPERGLFALKASAAQCAFAEWLFHALTDPPTAEKREFRSSAGRDDVTRVFFVKDSNTVQNLHEMTVGIRTIGAIPRLFAYNRRKAIAVRATEEQTKLTEWLIRELDQSSDRPNEASAEMRMADNPDSVVRVFYFSETMTAENLNRLSVHIRSTTGVQRLFVYPSLRAMVARGTPNQMATVQHLANQ